MRIGGRINFNPAGGAGLRARQIESRGYFNRRAGDDQKFIRRALGDAQLLAQRSAPTTVQRTGGDGCGCSD